MSRAGVFLALCALIPIGLKAQGSLVHATIDSGILVRMHPASGTPILGRLVQPLGPSTTTIRFCRYPAPQCTDPTDSVVIQRRLTTSIARLEVQRGDHWATGAGIGGAIGLLFGGFVGALRNGFCEESSGCGPSTGAFAAIGAIGFGVIGALIGSGSPKWRPAP